MVGFLAAGLASKNIRSRTECLEELGGIIERHGLEVCERGTKARARCHPGCLLRGCRRLPSPGPSRPRRIL